MSAATVDPVKLMPLDVRAIRSLVAAGERHYLIAEQFGVSKANVSHIVTGRNWGWL